MKILLLAAYFYPYEENRTYSGGVQLASSPTEIAEKLSEKHDVTVMSRRTGSTRKKSFENNVEVFRTGFLDILGFRLISWVLSAFLGILRLNREKGFDVIVCWDWSTALPAVLAKPFIKTPVLCSIRNQSQAYGSSNRFKFIFYYVLERFVFNRSDFLVYSSSWVKETVEKVMKIKTPSSVLHHGIDFKKFNPRVRSEVAKKLGLGDFVVGFFGRLIREKGVHLLMESFAEFGRHSKNSSLLIVGDGEEMENLRSLARELGIEKRTRFVGFVHRKRIPEYMQACDAVVLPSEAEGFSSVVLESMAMGKVFVGTEVGGVPEMIENWKNGVRIKTDDEKDLANAFKRLYEDKKLMKKIGKNAYRFVKERGYGWDKYILKWEKVLESVPQYNKIRVVKE
jgi:glycosyltransferase involved in cell wall biosynthesis